MAFRMVRLASRFQPSPEGYDSILSENEIIVEVNVAKLENLERMHDLALDYCAAHGDWATHAVMSDELYRKVAAEWSWRCTQVVGQMNLPRKLAFGGGPEVPIILAPVAEPVMVCDAPTVIMRRPRK